MNFLLPHIRRMPNRIQRDEFAADAAQKLGIDSAMMRQELKQAAAQRVESVRSHRQEPISETEQILLRALVLPETDAGAAAGRRAAGGATRVDCRPADGGPAGGAGAGAAPDESAGRGADRRAAGATGADAGASRRDERSHRGYGRRCALYVETRRLERRQRELRNQIAEADRRGDQEMLTSSQPKRCRWISSCGSDRSSGVVWSGPRKISSRRGRGLLQSVASLNGSCLRRLYGRAFRGPLYPCLCSLGPRLMDGATKRRLLWSFLSGWVARLSSTVIQLVGVPVFLHFWSLPLYGNWIVVSSIPSYLSFSSVGFGSVAGNEMTMHVAREDYGGALRVFQSCWWLIAGLCAGILLLLSGALCVVPMAAVLRLSEISEADTRWILLALGVSVLLGQLEMLLQSAYRAVGRNAFGSFCKSSMSLAAFAATMVAVAAGEGPRGVALVFAGANVAGTLALAAMVKRDLPWIGFGWRHADGRRCGRCCGLRWRLWVPHRQRAESAGNGAGGELRAGAGGVVIFGPRGRSRGWRCRWCRW